MKNSTPLARARGVHPPPPVNPSQHTVGFIGGGDGVDRGTHPWPTGECKNQKGGGALQIEFTIPLSI